MFIENGGCGSWENTLVQKSPQGDILFIKQVK